MNCVKIKQIRNATLRVSFGGLDFLIDPWLIGKDEGFTFRQGGFAAEVVDEATLDLVMPMRELPVPLAEVLGGVDAYILTHLHPDHFDMSPDGMVGAPRADFKCNHHHHEDGHSCGDHHHDGGHSCGGHCH